MVFQHLRAAEGPGYNARMRSIRGMRNALFVAGLTCALLAGAAVPSTQPAAAFDATFTGAPCGWTTSTRVAMGQEIVALDRVVSDGPWAGSRTRLVDDLNLGKYLFEVIDRDTNRADLLARLRLHLR